MASDLWQTVLFVLNKSWSSLGSEIRKWLDRVEKNSANSTEIEMTKTKSFWRFTVFRPTGVKLLPLRPPPIKSVPGRPPPPSVNSSNQTPSSNKTPPASSSQTDSCVSTNQTQPSHKASKRGPPLPPRPKPGHPLYNSYVVRSWDTILISNCDKLSLLLISLLALIKSLVFVFQKQEVLIVLDDPSPAPSEPNSQSGDSNNPASECPLIDSTQCLLDLDPELDPVQKQTGETKSALEGLTDSQVFVMWSECRFQSWNGRNRSQRFVRGNKLHSQR